MSDDENNEDMTLLEDISEFLHEENSEIDDQLETGAPESPDEELPSLEDDNLEEGFEEVSLEETPNDSFEMETPLEEESSEEANFEMEEPVLEEPALEEEMSFESEANDEEENFPTLEEETPEENFEETSFETESEEPVLSEESFEETEASDFGAEEISDFSEPEELTSEEPAIEETPAPEPAVVAATPTEENFDDVKESAKHMTYGKIGTKGNPPFSVLITNIVYQEEAKQIYDILEDHKIITPENEKIMKESLDNGGILISQLGEYSAIYLAHKIRHFDCQMQIGLAHRIQAPKSYSDIPKGLISRDNLRQNKKIAKDLDVESLALKDIILATTTTLQGIEVLEYKGIVSEHTNIGEDQLEILEQNEVSEDEDKNLKHMQENLEDIYNKLTESLRMKAKKIKCNAVIGIQYQIMPLNRMKNDLNQYKITCTGNAAIVNYVDQE